MHIGYSQKYFPINELICPVTRDNMQSTCCTTNFKDLERSPLNQVVETTKFVM